MKYILAGNYRQYKDCIYELKLKPQQAHYISHPHKAMGIKLESEKDIITYGTWYELPWAQEALERLKSNIICH